MPTTSEPTTKPSEPEDKIYRRLTRPAGLTLLVAMPLLFRNPGTGTYHLTTLDVALSFVLTLVPGVVTGLVGLQFLEPEGGEDQVARDKSAREITHNWVIGLGSALLTLVLRLLNSQLLVPSPLQWYGVLSLLIFSNWLGVALGMINSADVRKVNLYLPDMMLAAAVLAGVALIITSVIAWRMW